MKIFLLKLLTLFLVVYSLNSCHEPIFYTVTQETPLIPPLIDGSPSNFVIFKNEIYVASGKNIFKYGKNEQSECKWSRMDLSGEKLGSYIVNLAATDNSLYAHYLDNNYGGIRRFNGNGNSSGVVLEEPQYIQTIYASANVLFICARKSGNTYAIYYLDEDVPSGNIKEIKGITSMLNGIAYDGDSEYYYLCTYSGIFYTKKDEFESSSKKNVYKEKEFTDYRFTKNTTVSTPPGYTDNANNPGSEWTEIPPTPLITDEYLWMIQADWKGSSRLSKWTEPVRISGPAEEAGNTDTTGNYHELIYVRAAERPATPTGDSPKNWTTDMPSGADSDRPLWMSRGIKNASGVLKDKWSVPVQITGEKGKDNKIITGFTGIINISENYIAAININGDLYEIKGAVITPRASFNDSRESTGALALWYRDKDDTTPSLLLAGRNEYYYSTISRYTNGYVEIALGTYEVEVKDPATGETVMNPDTNKPKTEKKFGIMPDAKFSEPGINSPTTIDNYNRYLSSLGKKIINFFIQAPSTIDEKMTLFASTQKNGVWSYRDRHDGEGETWNAEK